MTGRQRKTGTRKRVRKRAHSSKGGTSVSKVKEKPVAVRASAHPPLVTMKLRAGAAHEQMVKKRSKTKQKKRGRMKETKKKN